MQLVKVSIEGFRSIDKRLEIIIDSRVTVLLGANDHGKTNFLAALGFLNRERSFSSDDLNWDRADNGTEFPAIEYTLQLSNEEREKLSLLDIAQRLEAAATERCISVEGDVNRLAGSIDEAKANVEQGREALEAATATARDRREASANEPENLEARSAYVSAREAFDKAKVDLAKAKKLNDAYESQLGEVSLALSLAEARRRQADGLRASGELSDDYVEKLALEAEEVAESASKALKKSAAKVRAAQERMEALPEGAEESERSTVEAELQAAQAEEKQTRDESQKAVRAAARERAAATALESAARDPRVARDLDLPMASLSKARKPPSQIFVKRTGLKGGLAIEPCGDIELEALDQLIEARLPRVELVQPDDRLPDDVSASQLRGEDSPFMRGIFLYAGIREDEWDGIFTQDPQSRMRLETASETLNETLRASWSQGSHLTFQLAHDSKRSRIALEIKDPSVSTRFTRPSQRSGGFTHFFALRTVLHAMQCESPASSYLWLFDEPGIHLHPDGQRDLIQVMETLSETNQVLYTTHSIFLANQNYPTRHRLLMRTKGGTELDSKPYVSRWRTALAALGFSLAGTVLFAPHVLLVEGDSDAIYVTSILRRLIADGHLDLDLNRFSVIPTGDSANTGALIRILTDGIPVSARPALGLLVDGDKGGKARLKAVRSLVKDHRIATKDLSPANTTTEDHLPAAKKLYVEAVVAYLTEMCGLGAGKQGELRKSFIARFGDSETIGLAEWTRDEAREIAGLDEKPSPVGIARAYAEMLEDVELGELKPREISRARKLAQWIGEEVKVPAQTLVQDQILESDEES
jgi:recombinational DNA repair ATPase RecF